MIWLGGFIVISVTFSVGFVAGACWHAIHLDIAKATGERP